MPHWKCACKHMEGLYLVLWSRSGAAQKWGKAKGSPWAVMPFFVDPFSLSWEVCAPQINIWPPYTTIPPCTWMWTQTCASMIALLCPLGLFLSTNARKVHLHFMSGIENIEQLCSPTRLFVCSWENIISQMPSFKHTFKHPLKGASGWNGEIVLSHGVCLIILHISLLRSTPFMLTA